MVHAWLFVALAVIAEIAAALGLRYSNGFTRPVPTLAALAAFGTAFYLISLALVDLPVSIAYPISATPAVPPSSRSRRISGKASASRWWWRGSSS